MSDTSVWSWRGFSACSAASLVLQDLGGPRRGPLGVSLSPVVTGCVRCVATTAAGCVGPDSGLASRFEVRAAFVCPSSVFVFFHQAGIAARFFNKPQRVMETTVTSTPHPRPCFFFK